MADFVTKKIGQFDSYSVTLCKSYLDARYRLIWDAYYWRDAQNQATASLGAGVSSFAYPAGIERVVTIRIAGNKFLDPIDPTYLIEVDPTIFERSGVPLYYEEFTSGPPGTYAIKVYPTPTVTTAFLIVGKKACPGLTADSDTSMLRNCDNVLLAFAQFDMLEKLRQYQKAQAKLQEASSLLQSAQSLEQQQANQPRKNKNLSVQGNTLAEMADDVAAICNAWTPDMYILINQFLRRNYQKLYDTQLWPESTVQVNLSTNSQQVVLPDYIDRVVAVRGNNQMMLTAAEPVIYFQVSPSIFEQTGDPMSFSILTPVAVAVLPPSAEKLRFTSTDASDKGNVFVRGESGGTIRTETVVLNGTTNVDTVNLYDVPLTIGKGITAGDITVKGVTSGATLQTLPAAMREKKHLRLWLLPQPTSTQGLMVLGKRKIHPLVQDEDSPFLTGCQNVLIAGAATDLFLRLGNAAMAQQKQQEAQSAFQLLKSVNIDQSAYGPRFIPSPEPDVLWGGEMFVLNKDGSWN